MAPADAGTLPWLHDLGDGIHAIDTGFHRPQFDAAYLLVEAGRAAFIDTGTNFAVPRLLAALTSVGLGVDAVDWVVPTHVHLDHAGGVGGLMQHLPQAKVWVHPRGARHLVDPSALYQGALAVYGAEAMARNYGELLPVAADRVVSAGDQSVVHLAGRALLSLDTPGHARHHHCLWDERSQGWFSGDTFGLSYPECHSAQGPWLMPTSSPVQFEPDALHQSLHRLMARQPRWLYLTHFGRVAATPALADMLHRQIDQMVALARMCADAPERHQVLRGSLAALAQAELQAHGVADVPAALAAIDLDLELNAQGLAVWLDRPAA